MSRAVLIAALRRTAAMADAVLREAMQADPGDPANADDELALRRIEWMADALEADADASQPMSLRPKNSRERRPIMLDLTPEEQFETMGATFADLDKLADSIVFRCGVCRDTGTEHKTNRHGDLRSTGRACPDCTSTKPVKDRRYITLSSTGRRVRLYSEISLAEKQELRGLCENGVDPEVRRLALAILRTDANVPDDGDPDDPDDWCPGEEPEHVRRSQRMDGVQTVQTVTAGGEQMQVRVWSEPRGTHDERGIAVNHDGVAFERCIYFRNRPLPTAALTAFRAFANGTRSGARTHERRLMREIVADHEDFDVNSYEQQHLDDQHTTVSNRVRSYLNRRTAREEGDPGELLRTPVSPRVQPVAAPPREPPIMLRWGTRVDTVAAGTGLTPQERARFIGQLEVDRQRRVVYRVEPHGDDRATESEICEVLKADTNYRFIVEGAEYALGDPIPARHRAFMQSFAVRTRTRQTQTRAMTDPSRRVLARRGVQAMMAEHLLSHAPVAPDPGVNDGRIVAVDASQIDALRNLAEADVWSFGMTRFPGQPCTVRYRERMDDWQREIVRRVADATIGQGWTLVQREKARRFLRDEPTYLPRPTQGTDALHWERLLTHYIKIGTSSGPHGVEVLRPGDLLSARQRDALLRSYETIMRTPVRRRRQDWERRVRFIRRVIDASDHLG